MRRAENDNPPMLRWFCRCDGCLERRPWEAFGMLPPPPLPVNKD